MKQSTKKDRQLLDFGRSLKRARIAAGFSSLSQGLLAISKSEKGTKFSKSTLNFIENGKISDINIQFLKALCKTYGLNYQEKLTEYLRIKFDLPKNIFETKSKILKKIDSQEIILGGPTKVAPIIQILTLDKFSKIQSKLPPHSIVAVSSIHFLDDNVLFEMVLENIRRGICYYYYIPESHEIRYRKFISQVSHGLSITADKIDKIICHFIPRSISEFPLNSILFIYPDKKISGYVGLSAEEEKILFIQKADELFSWKLYQSFLMAFSASSDEIIQARLSDLSLGLKKLAHIKGFPVLLNNLGR